MILGSKNRQKYGKDKVVSVGFDKKHGPAFGQDQEVVFPQAACGRGSSRQSDGGARVWGPNPDEVFEAVLDGLVLITRKQLRNASQISRVVQLTEYIVVDEEDQ